MGKDYPGVEFTGNPPGLLQDDCRALSLWFAGRLGAKHLVRMQYAENVRRATDFPSPSQTLLFPDQENLT